jgi:hypothetical protein
MVVAIVCGGVSGNAWLVADACPLGTRRRRPAPTSPVRCGRRGPIHPAADRPSTAPADAHLTACVNTGWGG